MTTTLINESFVLLKILHNFYKNCSINDSIFIDKEDLEIFTDNHEFLLEIVKTLAIKVINDTNTYKDVLSTLIVCYILCIKYYTDCWFSSKPYSNIINILGLDWLESKKLVKLEKIILKKVDYKL
jgi:hypothetical protein